MKILFKITTRSRPENFLRCLKSILDNVEGDEYRIYVSVDANDLSMSNKFLEDVFSLNENIFISVGESKNKINAINRDIRFDYDWDILVNVSDDMVFTKKGFDNDIRKAFSTECFIVGYNALDKVVHFPDQYQRENCMTMSIIGRDYYNRDGWIYNPKFESLWCDVVAQEVAQIRGCYKYVDKDIFVHLHPSLGLAPYDELAMKTEAFDVRMRDYNTYLELKKEYDPNNIFPIRSI